MHKYTLKTICYSYQLVWVQSRAGLKLVILHYIEERIKGLKLVILHYIEERIKGLKLVILHEVPPNRKSSCLHSSVWEGLQTYC